MGNDTLTQSGKFLSPVLRHQPEAAGILLDTAGWVEVEALLAGLARAGHPPLTRETLTAPVENNDKRRFEFDGTGGGSGPVRGIRWPWELEYPAGVPPEVLYHGTVASCLEPIRREGLRPMERLQVHLSAEPDQARTVGARRGKPVVLLLDAGERHRAGGVFRRSTNGVWLTNAVPPDYITFP